MNMKTCSRCKEELPLSAFHKSMTGSQGVQGYCKECKKSVSPKYEDSRRGKRSEYGKAQWEKNKGNPEYHERRRRWLEANADEQKRKQSERYQENKQVYAAYRANQRAKDKGCYGILIRSDWEYLITLCAGKCLSCESEEYLTLDHINPLDAGGENLIGNVQPLCLRCHMKKGVRVVDFRTREFVQQVRENCQGEFMGQG